MRLFDRLRPQTASDSRTKSRPRRFRPGTEKLDERVMPAVTFHGGLVLPHVQVSNVFYGQNWSAADASGASRSALNQFQADITQSPYMAMLGECGVGRGKFIGSDNVTGAGTPASGGAVNPGRPFAG
jgi:hypothetical protein